MKRLIGLLLILAIAPLLSAQESLVIGVVTYRMDALTPDVAAFGEALSSETQSSYVDLYEIRAAEFCRRDANSEMLSRISHWVEFMDAVYQNTGGVADGLVATPPIPTAETEELEAEFAAVAQDLPVILTMRRVPGLNLPLIGLDLEKLGRAWASQMQADGRHPFAVVGLFSDPMQADLLEGLKTSSDFRGEYNVGQLDGAAEATAAVTDHPDINVIIVTDITYVLGVSDVTEYLLTNNNRAVRIGALGAPQDWESLLIDKRLLSGMIVWDHYDVLRRAVSAMELHLRGGVALVDLRVDAIFYGPSGEPTPLPYPYDDPAVWAEFWE